MIVGYTEIFFKTFSALAILTHDKGKEDDSCDRLMNNFAVCILNSVEHKNFRTKVVLCKHNSTKERTFTIHSKTV